MAGIMSCSKCCAREWTVAPYCDDCWEIVSWQVAHSSKSCIDACVRVDNAWKERTAQRQDEAA